MNSNRSLISSRQLPMKSDVIVDNVTATVNGTWTSSTGAPGFYGLDYIYTTSNKNDTKKVTWSFYIGVAGDYDVYMNLPDGTGGRDALAEFVINHSEGSTRVRVDQRIRGGKWVYLGSYYFAQGNAGSIVVQSQSSSTVTINADAVRVTRRIQALDTEGAPELRAAAVTGNVVHLQIGYKGSSSDRIWVERRVGDETFAFTLPNGSSELYDTFNLLSTEATYSYRARKIGSSSVSDWVSVLKPAFRTVSYDILVSAAGYKPKAKKSILVQGATAATSVNIVNATTEQVVATKTLNAVTDMLGGSLLVGDFSDVTVPGYYYLRTDNGLNSTTFRIAEDVYDEFNRVSVRNLYYTRWPETLEAPREDTGAIMDIGGGWEDAWDYKHWTSYNDTIQPFALMELVLSGLSLPGLEEELRYGLTYLLKIQERTLGGSGNMKFGQLIAAYSGVFSSDSTPFVVRVENVDVEDLGGYNKRCEHVLAHYLYALTLAKASRYFANEKEYSQRLLTQAKDAFAYMVQYDEITRVKYAEFFTTKDYFRAYPSLNYCYKALAAQELYEITGEATYQNTVKTYLNKLVQGQKKAFKWNSRKLTGYFMKDETSTTPMRNRIHNGIPLYALAVLLRKVDVSDTEWFTWFASMILHTECYIKKFYPVTTFGIMPYGFEVGPRKMDSADTLNFRFFQGTESQANSYSDGNTKTLALYASAMFEAAITTGDLTLEEIGHKQLEWVFGSNVYGTPAIAGFGDTKLPSTRMTSHGYEANSFETVGCAVNGIDGGSGSDNPQWGNNWQTGETWGVNRAWIQMAVSSLRKLDTARTMVMQPNLIKAISSPETAVAGANFTVTVTLQNVYDHPVDAKFRYYADNATTAATTRTISLAPGETKNTTITFTAGVADKPCVIAAFGEGSRNKPKATVVYVT